MTAIIYNGLVVYGPALAMNQVAGLDLNVAILLVGAVCIFYTVIGGMKAVVWTDVWQTMWMISGFIAILSVTCVDFEGFWEVVTIARSGNRFPQQFEEGFKFLSLLRNDPKSYLKTNKA